MHEWRDGGQVEIRGRATFECEAHSIEVSRLEATRVIVSFKEWHLFVVVADVVFHWAFTHSVV